MVQIFVICVIFEYSYCFFFILKLTELFSQVLERKCSHLSLLQRTNSQWFGLEAWSYSPIIIILFYHTLLLLLYCFRSKFGLKSGFEIWPTVPKLWSIIMILNNLKYIVWTQCIMSWTYWRYFRIYLKLSTYEICLYHQCFLIYTRVSHY